MNHERSYFQESIEKGIKTVEQMIEEINLYEQNAEKNEENSNHQDFVKQIEETNMKIAQATSEWHSLIVTNPILFDSS